MSNGAEKEGTSLFLRLIETHFSVTAPVKSDAQLEREKWLVPGYIKFNRWACLPAAFVIQFCCGSISSWSVLNKPIDFHIYGENRNLAPITFYIAVGFLGGSAALMGSWLERHGPLVTCILGTILFFAGNLLTALALYLRQMWLVFVGYGVVAGFGMGVCYISPVSTLQKWFPDWKGFASGFAVCGVGAGSIVISKVLLPLIDLVGLPLTFVTLGSTYLLCIMISASVLRTPPPGYTTKSTSIQQNSNEMKTNNSEAQGHDNTAYEADIEQSTDTSVTDIRDKPASMTLLQALTSKDFRLLFIVFTCSILFGLMLASRLSNIITDIFGKTAAEASTVVSVNAGMNMIGRLVAASSEYTGRKNYFLVILSVQVIILAAVSFLMNHKAYVPFVLCMWLVTGCYGSAFGSIPALLSDKFATANGGACHGVVLTGWSFAAIVGGLTFTLLFNAFLPLDPLPSDPYPYIVNMWWIFGIACLGMVALVFVKPTPQDLSFNSKIKKLFN